MKCLEVKNETRTKKQNVEGKRRCKIQRLWFTFDSVKIAIIKSHNKNAIHCELIMNRTEQNRYVFLEYIMKDIVMNMNIISLWHSLPATNYSFNVTGFFSWDVIPNSVGLGERLHFGIICICCMNTWHINFPDIYINSFCSFLLQFIDWKLVENAVSFI